MPWAYSDSYCSCFRGFFMANIGEISLTDSINFEVKVRELQYRFDKFITSCCTPFAPRDSSDRMKTALYKFLQENCNIEKYSSEGQKIVLGKENIQTFLNTLNQSKEEYKETVVKSLNDKKLIEKFQWEVPLLISYNDKYKDIANKKSIMEPLFMRNPSEPEKKFMDMLDNSGKVKWWFKNGESDKKYFAILYKDTHGLEHAFYVDFIVKFKEGMLGLYDTKGGATTEGAKFRAEGLQRYLKEEKKEGKKLDGGIVIFEDGSFWINRNKQYSYNPNKLSDGWEIFNL